MTGLTWIMLASLVLNMAAICISLRLYLRTRRYLLERQREGWR